MTYLATYSFLVVSHFFAVATRTRTLVFMLCVFFLFLFVGMREWTGCDFSGYLNRFELYKADSIDYMSLFSEPGFALLNKIIIWLGLEYMWLNVACSAIFFYAVTKFALRRENSVALLALFFPILIIQLSMSGLRQALAVAFLLFAWNAFVDRRRLQMLAWIVLATLFHSSAVVFAPMVLLVGRQVSLMRLTAATLVIAPFAAFMAGERLDTYQTRYIEGDSESAGAIYRVLLTLITAVFFELYRQNYKKYYPDDFELMRAFSIFSFVLVLVFLVSTTASHRINYYIMPVQLLMLVRLPRMMLKGKKDPLLELGPYIVYLAYMVVWFGTSRHARLCYMPYDSYLF